MSESGKNIGLFQILKNIWLEDVPSYGNKLFYSLGFLSMTCFLVLVFTGVLLIFFGPDWWFTNPLGVFIRSLHLWAVQAFVLFMLLHSLIVFLTGGYRPPRRLSWVIGVMMFFLALMEAEFGYVLRNDFSAQWRSLQGADLYNGSGLGKFINNLNYAQIYGIHIIIIPLLIFGLLFLHYAYVRLRGIATPYKKDVPYRMVKANHTMLFLRGIILTGILVALALIFPSPIIAPVTIKQIAQDDPSLMATTLISEINKSSDTATYSDTIDPYQFDTALVYVYTPYNQYIMAQPNAMNMLDYFRNEDKQTQDNNLNAAKDYFDKKGSLTTEPNLQNPVIPMISSLVMLGQSGLYEASLRSQSTIDYNPIYVLRFLSDTGVPEENADKLGITTEKYGMLREEKGLLPPGAWWLAPLGLLDNTILKNDDNQDQHGAEILGLSVLFFLAFPYIPFLNQLPDKLGLYKLIWKDKQLATTQNQ